MLWEVLAPLVAPSPGRCAKRWGVGPGAMIVSLWNDGARITSPGSPGVANRKLRAALAVPPVLSRSLISRYRRNSSAHGARRHARGMDAATPALQSKPEYAGARKWDTSVPLSQSAEAR